MCSYDEPGPFLLPLQRALESEDLRQIQLAASELPQVNLSDALRICLMMRGHPAYDRAVVRWLGRFVTETPGLTMQDLDIALGAFEHMPEEPNASMEQLAGLCRRLRVP